MPGVCVFIMWVFNASSAPFFSCCHLNRVILPWTSWWTACASQGPSAMPISFLWTSLLGPDWLKKSYISSTSKKSNWRDKGRHQAPSSWYWVVGISMHISQAAFITNGLASAHMENGGRKKGINSAAARYWSVCPSILRLLLQLILALILLPPGAC